MQVSEFLKLPPKTREAAYQRARERLGPEALRLTVLVQAAKDTAEEAI